MLLPVARSARFSICRCLSWTLVSESPRSGLAVLEVGVPTGYMVQQQALDEYVLSRRVPTLQRAKYQVTKMLFYFDYVSMGYYWSKAPKKLTI